MDYYAHSSPKENPALAPHRYADHINEMLVHGVPLFDYLLSFSVLPDLEKEALKQTFKAALMLHDMGKLDEGIQKVLRGEEKGRLPIDHIEAGVAVAAEMKNELLGWLIRAHHAPGLPSKKTEKSFIRQLRLKCQLALDYYCLRGLRRNRDKSADWGKNCDAIIATNKNIETYKKRQLEACGEWPTLRLLLPNDSLVPRLMLSCLVEVDHGSAACYSQGVTMPTFNSTDGRWQERLQRLNHYISGLANKKGESNNIRNQLRNDFYQHCAEGELHKSRIVSCTAPVGLGKTTSVMAYLFRCAISNNLNRIFIVAPFSNIIDQTVKVLRKAIVLEDEDPEAVIVAHHHKADFSSKEMRQYAVSWKAPIVVTTAVQFFETIAAANPSKLRKLHNVVGAAIFIDESHACLPPELLNVSWYWMKRLADDWKCNFVYSSGSIVKFWEDKYLVGQAVSAIPDLLPESIRKLSHDMESARVIYRRAGTLKRDALVAKIQSIETWSEHLDKNKPSCLIILNTVQSAAVIADALAKSLNDKNSNIENKAVLHLSTALAPKDREEILKEIERRQEKSEWDSKSWYLVATSCVEAGVDLDFAIGFRETCSVTSFLQVSGRINRHGKRAYGILFDFSVFSEDGLNHHPGFRESSDIFNRLWDELTNGTTDTASLCSKAVRNELLRYQSKREKSNLLLEEEIAQGYQEISEKYRLIDSDTATVIVCKDLVERLEKGMPVSWTTIQESSVQLWMNNIKKLKLKEISGCEHDGIYSWTDSYEYDSKFLGIMGGILNPEAFFAETGGVFS